VKRSNRLLILLGLLIAISAAFAAAAYVSSGGGGSTGNAESSPTATPEPTVVVVVAAKAIPAGTMITADMLKTTQKTLSARNALGADTFDSVEQVTGKIAGADIAADQVIVASKDLLSPGSVLDGKSLSDSIAKGFVAVSMEADQTNGVGTLMVPGDYVDIILTTWVEQIAVTFANTGSSFPGGSQVTSKLVIQDRRILATLLPPVAASGATAAPAAAGSGPAVTPVPSSAVVQFNGRHMIVVAEVTPDEAELIRWAQRAEKQDPQNYITLGFALRSSKDEGQTPDTVIKTSGVTFRVLVEKYKVLPPDPTWTLPENIRVKVQW